MVEQAQPLKSAESASVQQASKSLLSQRLLSLDVYRGLIMVSLAFSGFGLVGTAANHLEDHPDSALWQTIRYQFDHVQWVGCAYWDLIQPSFMFMVGAAMAFSYAKRKQQGQSYPRMLAHAVWRSIVLILLGIFLISNSMQSTNWSLMNVLTQIGLGYTFLFLLWGRPWQVQAVVAIVILAGTWLAYDLYPYSGIDVSRGAPEVGVTQVWAERNLADVPPAWHKNANIGHAVDLWLLNLLPQKQPFRYSGGGYQTINFIPSLATMLFGLMCGELLRSGRSASSKLWILLLAGLFGLGTGLVLDMTGICPLVKRIWTPSWALFSTGWCCLILAGLYSVCDVLGYRKWAFPLVVVGVNSIAIYCMDMLLKNWTASTWQKHLGRDFFYSWGAENEPSMRAIFVGLSFWLVCLWMYRQKIFIRI
jgi:predicted acyltransferase